VTAKAAANRRGLTAWTMSQGFCVINDVSERELTRSNVWPLWDKGQGVRTPRADGPMACEHRTRVGDFQRGWACGLGLDGQNPAIRNGIDRHLLVYKKFAGI